MTGAAGFIGSHVVESLLERGDEVIGIDNFDPFYSRELKEGNLTGARRHSRFTFFEGDIGDLSLLRSALTSETVILHLAAKAGVRPSIADPVGYARANVLGTATVVEAARQAGVRRMVLASSSSVYGNDTPSPFREDASALHPVSPYAATKRGAELLLMSVAPLIDLRVAALRYFTVFGPRQRPDLAIHSFARRMLAGEAITLFGTGSEARDYTYCADIVAGTLAAMDWTATAPAGVEVFNLGGNRSIALRELVESLAAAIGVVPKIMWAPMQPGDVNFTSADLSKSLRVLGYSPATSFEEGIDRFVEWCRGVYGHQH